jgi:hypothetical protein
MPGFWDSMGPAYQRLPAPLPFAPNVPAAQVGALLVGGIAAVTAVHGAATYAREVGRRVAARRQRSATVEGSPEGEPVAPTAPVAEASGPAAKGAAEVAAEPPTAAEPPGHAVEGTAEPSNVAEPPGPTDSGEA